MDYCDSLSTGNSRLIDLIIAFGFEDIILSLHIPRSGSPIDQRRLMDLARNVSGHAGPFFWDDYLKAIRESFYQVLIKLVPARSGDRLLVEEVLTNPTLQDVKLL
jgi:hypothetical protein